MRRFVSFVLAAPFLLASLVLAGCDPGEATKTFVSTAVAGTVEVGKGVIDGARAGVERGREEQSIDGVQVLATRDAIAATLSFEAWVVDAGTVRVVLENPTDRPVRIGRLDEVETLAIDVEGISTPLAAPGHLLGTAIDVPAHAKVEVAMTFRPTGRDLAAVRIAGMEHPVR